MKGRIKEIIEYSTGGVLVDFARRMNWSPQYLNRVINSKGGVGIKPIASILEVFPEINARWLILGEGTMLGEEKRDFTRIKQLISELKELAK